MVTVTAFSHAVRPQPHLPNSGIDIPDTIITKAVFPIAGLVTRFVPTTKASAKEMLPVVDKPLIQ